MLNMWDERMAIESAIVRAVAFGKAARREGLLTLEEMLVLKDGFYRDDLFEYGMRLVIDGTDGELIDDLMSNIIKTESESDTQSTRTLKEIQKAACLAIQRGENPRILALRLTSYLTADHAKKVYKLLEGKDDTE